jgi:plasmid stabilization system protein ParE
VSGYKLTVSAGFDLQEIWDFIARDSANAADRWIGRLYDAFEMLGQSPGIGHSREDLAAGPVRFWPVDRYLIVFRVQNDVVEILAVTQGSRNIPTLLRDRL